MRTRTRLPLCLLGHKRGTGECQGKQVRSAFQANLANSGQAKKVIQTNSKHFLESAVEIVLENSDI